MPIIDAISVVHTSLPLTAKCYFVVLELDSLARKDAVFAPFANDHFGMLLLGDKDPVPDGQAGLAVGSSNFCRFAKEPSRFVISSLRIEDFVRTVGRWSCRISRTWLLRICDALCGALVFVSHFCDEGLEGLAYHGNEEGSRFYVSIHCV